MYDRIVKHAVFPLSQVLLGGGTLEYISEWEKAQWLSRDELAALQFDKLRGILAHSAASVPYYRSEWKKLGFDPRGVKSIDDIRALPVLEKSVLRERTKEFVTEGLTEKLHTARTGGSTGEPLAFPVGASLRAGSVANMVRCRRWWGIDAGDRSVNFWGHSRYVRGRAVDRAKKALSTLKDRALNRIVCSAYDLSDESMSRYWERIRAFRPAFLIGYATSLYVFADFVLRRKFDGADTGLKAVISTAEVLYDWQEDVIRRAFGCPVVSEYGMCEVGIIAYQCPSDSMHAMDESLIVETIPVEGSNEGDIVVTELENSAAPLIRYNTKDMASEVAGACACGRGLSRLSRISGRAYDIIYAADGRVVAGALLTHVMKKTAAIAKYQILQRDLVTLEISYVEAAPLADADRTAIVETLRSHLGRDVKIGLARAGDIPKELSGKHRWLRSLVTRDDAERKRGAAK
jgi:phenylacetate-CoA ligase